MGHMEFRLFSPVDQVIAGSIYDARSNSIICQIDWDSNYSEEVLANLLRAWIIVVKLDLKLMKIFRIVKYIF